MAEDQVFLARDYYGRGHKEMALKILEQCEIQANNSAHIEASLLLVDVLNDLGRFNDARELVESLLTHFPESYTVIDGAISLYSGEKDTALDAQRLALERIQRLPHSCWSYYILAHVGFYHLDAPKEAVLKNIDKSLQINNHTHYLDKAYVFYDYYDCEEKRDFCLEQMIRNNPEQEATRAKLFQNLKKKKQYREAAEVALEFFKDFPSSRAIKTFAIEELKGELAKTPFQQRVSEAQNKLECWYDSIVHHDSVGVRVFLGLPFRLTYLLLFPYLIPSMISSQNHIHLAAIKRDELYRKLCSSRDHILEQDGTVLLYCPDSDTGTKVMVFERHRIHIADDLISTISTAAGAFEEQNFLNPKSYKRSSIKEFSAHKAVFALESSWTITDLEYSSPETVSAIKEHLIKLDWKRCNNRVWEVLGSIFCIKILLYITAGAGGLAAAATGSTLAIIYSAGIPFFWMSIYIKNIVFSTRSYSFKPRRERKNSTPLAV